MAWCEQQPASTTCSASPATRAWSTTIAVELAAAPGQRPRTGKPARRFKDFRWTTLDSWSRARRVIAKAEWTQRRGQPALRRHLAQAQRGGRAAALRGHLLRPRRDGEPHQGMPARPVRRPHLGRHHARQPAAAVVRLDGLCAALRPAPHRPCGTPSSPRPPAARSGSSSSRSARWSASPSAASRSPWPRPAQPPKNGAARLAAWPKPPRHAPRRPDTRRRHAPNRRHHQQGPTETHTKNQIAASAFGATILVAFSRSTNTRRRSIGSVRNAG